jgi:broad specificity phosphatase PhoE
MHVYFVRHAESIANAERIITSQPTVPYPLTEKGEEQAKAVADQLREVEFTAAYSSHLMRAVQTAEIILEGREIALKQDQLLNEHDAGKLNDRRDQQAWEQLERIYHAWIDGDVEARPDGGESLLDLQTRFGQFIEQLRGQGNPGVDTYLIVGHAGLYWGNLPFLFENVDFEFAREHGIENASVIIAEDDGSTWRCVSWDGLKL